MADDALYVADDGEIMAFEASTTYVQADEIPDPYPGDTWRYDSLTGLPLPHLTTQHRRWTRLDAPPHVETALRRLIAEREEARELVALAHSAAPALCGAGDWAVWDRVKKALRLWGRL